MPNLSFLQAGSNDGKTNDWLYESVRTQGWSGICLEPQPGIFEKLQDTYRPYPKVHLLQAAIAAERQQRPFYYFVHDDPVLGPASDKLASFDKELLFANVKIELSKLPQLAAIMEHRLDDYVREEVVECYTIADLVDRFGFVPDLIALDIEGYEADILLSLDFSRIKPKHIFFEAFHIPAPKKELCKKRLREAGYTFQGIEEFDSTDWNILASLENA